VRCVICNESNWENVDQYRFKKEGMSLCQSCGFVSYPEKYKTKEEIIEFYREEYRPAPTSGNFFTGQRKLHYHAAFLKDEVNRLRDLEDPNLLEIGSAYGLYLHWLGKAVPKAKLTGTEITTSFKRVAKHQFGLDLVDDFSDDEKYDLISTYKVAEHMLDIDKEMERYHKTLKDDGRLYIGVPCWFNTMHNFGMGGWDIEYYYSTNHINVWTRKTFELLLKKTGFKIIQQDHEMYDSVYLCEKTEPQPINPSEFDGPAKIKGYLNAVKTANDLFLDKKMIDALNIWNDFPAAIMNSYEMNRKQYDSMGFEWIEENVINKSRKMCNDSPAILGFATDLYARYDKLEKAIETADLGLSKQPGSVVFILAIATSLYRLAETEKDKELKQKYYRESREAYKHLKAMSPQHFNEALNWIYLLDSKIEV
jgi:SAM-dependent methyltransferase